MARATRSRICESSAVDADTPNCPTGNPHSPTLPVIDRLPTTPARRRATAVIGGAIITLQVLIAPVAAQSTVGSSLCGTPIANFINSAAPLIVALAMVVGTVFAYVMHTRAGFAGDTEQARFYIDWRNRAGYTAVTAPLLAFLLEMMIGFTGTGVASCINLVPFF